jgi:hypothetical protein
MGHFIPLTLDHPMKFPCITMLLKVYGGIEVSDDFIVPILLECQYISQVLGRASNNDSIEDGNMTLSKIGSCLFSM